MNVLQVVTMTPVWDTNVHNTARTGCFKLLAAAVMRAAKQHNMEPETRAKMVEMMAASTIRDVEICRDHLAQSLSLTPKHSDNSP